ncbi:MAG: cupin domain-containing protein [Candidatus Aenigmarchaeota archaeon]|nr:cupin domain-containing protein [Candidatus Aenigmarchaeota archaeon]
MEAIEEVKGWGTMQHLFFKNNVEICRAEIGAGKTCSKHRHKFKHNGFFVESGKLIVRSWKGADSCQEIVLKEKDVLVVPPGVLHQFEAVEDTVAYEIYWVEIEKGDIEREV